MISTGTESLIARGLVSGRFMESMTVPYMEGSFALPIKYGYALIGEDPSGHRYHVMHPHQSHISVRAEDVYQLPADLSSERACLISNMETIINAIWDGDPKSNDKVAICGFGNIGALLAMTLRVHYDIHPSIIETDEWRLEKAMQLGFEVNDHASYDVVYHTSATSQGLQWCIDHLQKEGRVVELSWYGDKSVQLNLGANFHYDRLKIVSSQVSSIPSSMAGEYDYKKRKNLVAELLKNDQYDKLISQIIPFEESPIFFNQLRKGDHGNGLIYLIQY